MLQSGMLQGPFHRNCLFGARYDVIGMTCSEVAPVGESARHPMVRPVFVEGADGKTCNTDYGHSVRALAKLESTRPLTLRRSRLIPDHSSAIMLPPLFLLSIVYYAGSFSRQGNQEEEEASS